MLSAGGEARQPFKPGSLAAGESIPGARRSRPVRLDRRPRASGGPAARRRPRRPPSPWPSHRFGHEHLRRLGPQHHIPRRRRRRAGLLEAPFSLPSSRRTCTDLCAQPATGAFYREYYNPSQGVIVGTDNASPTYAAKGDTPIPELGCWSDLVWLEWAQQCAAAGTDPGALQYVVRDHIVTGETLVVVEHVLTRLGKAFDPPWDQRVEVPVCTEGLVTPEGTALLGTPHGYGVGYLLTQHRASIRKRVGSITIFATKPNAFSPWQTHMLFNLVDLAG